MKRWIALLVSVLPLAGCTIATPFKGPGYEPQKGITLAAVDTVYVGLTLAELKEDRELQAKFWYHVRKVEDSLETLPGFVGYSKRTRLFGNQAWTMTVWTDEESLDRFVQSEVHQTAIRESMEAIELASFARVALKREEIPISWEDALAILDAQNGRY